MWRDTHLKTISVTQINAYWYVRGKHFDFWQGTILFSGNRVSWAPLTKSPPSKILRALVPRGDPIALKIFSDGLLVVAPTPLIVFQIKLVGTLINKFQ